MVDTRPGPTADPASPLASRTPQGRRETTMPNDRPRGLPTVGEGCTTILGPGKSSVRQARELVRKRLAEYGLQDLVDIAELLVSELATNAVVHAGGRYRLTLSLGTGTLRCEVADERPLLPLPPHRQAGSDDHLDVDPDSENGRGLLLVDALAHRWGSRLVDDGKEVWFELELGTPEGTGETAEDVHLPGPARSRPPEPCGRTEAHGRRTEAHGRAESHQERTDHGYSPDGDHTEILRPLGMVASMWAPGMRRSGTSGLRAPSWSAAAIRPTPRRATSRYRSTLSRGRVVRLRPRAASREPQAALPQAASRSAVSRLPVSGRRLRLSAATTGRVPAAVRPPRISVASAPTRPPRTGTRRASRWRTASRRRCP